MGEPGSPSIVVLLWMEPIVLFCLVWREHLKRWQCTDLFFNSTVNRQLFYCSLFWMQYCMKCLARSEWSMITVNSRFVQISTTETRATLTNLLSNTQYSVKVSSMGVNGSSLPSPSLIFLTYPPPGTNSSLLLIGLNLSSSFSDGIILVLSQPENQGKPDKRFLLKFPLGEKSGNLRKML